MQNLGPAFLALLAAAVITALELVTTKYPRTFFVLTIRRCPSLYIYSLIYGFIAFIILLTGILDVSGQFKINVWLQAILIGIGIKAFFHIRFFSVPSSTATGSDSIPVGFETLVYTFEPWFLRTIDLDEFNGVESFLARWLQKYPNPESVRQAIRANVPRKLLSKAEYASLLSDLESTLGDAGPDNSKKVQDALEIYLRYMGRKSLDRVFPT